MVLCSQQLEINNRRKQAVQIFVFYSSINNYKLTYLSVYYSNQNDMIWYILFLRLYGQNYLLMQWPVIKNKKNHKVSTGMLIAVNAFYIVKLVQTKWRDQSHNYNNQTICFDISCSYVYMDKSVCWCNGLSTKNTKFISTGTKRFLYMS